MSVYYGFKKFEKSYPQNNYQYLVYKLIIHS